MARHGQELWKKHRYAVLAVLLLAHVLAQIDRNIVVGFSPQITADLGLSNAQYGFLAGAVWVLSFAVMAVLMGALADRFSRPRVIAAGILIWSVCTGASGFAQDFGHLVAARFLVASGEAALVPAAISLLVELFSVQRCGTAIGLFFMGIPLGIGSSFLVAGTVGALAGWRHTFQVLAVLGVLFALPMFTLREKRGADQGERGEPVVAQLRAALGLVKRNPAIQWTLAGFVLVHMAFAGLSFTQLWLVRERGLEPAAIARTLGLLGIVFGALGSCGGGALGDRVAPYLPGGRTGFAALLVALCVPLMVAYRFAAPGSVLFYAGMCAGFFLPLACYGPVNAVLQQATPPGMRSTISGLAMLLINLFAIAIGNYAVGAVSDHLARAGFADSLRLALLGTDALAGLSFVFFALAARSSPALRRPARSAMVSL